MDEQYKILREYQVKARNGSNSSIINLWKHINKVCKFPKEDVLEAITLLIKIADTDKSKMLDTLYYDEACEALSLLYKHGFSENYVWWVEPNTELSFKYYDLISRYKQESAIRDEYYSERYIEPY